MNQIKSTLFHIRHKVVALVLALSFLLSLFPTGLVAVTANAIGEATSNITYVGTLGTGENLTFANGVGYKLYSDEDCSVALSNGRFNKDIALIFYIKFDEFYSFWDLTIIDEDTNASVTPVIEDNNGVKKVTIAANDMTVNRKLKVSVITAVDAYGGIINSDSTAAEVAKMFDASFDGEADGDIVTTDNVTVTKVENEFTVTITNNILLDGSYYGRNENMSNNLYVTQAEFEYNQGVNGRIVELGTAYHGVYLQSGTLQLLSSGDHTIKRNRPDDFTGNMFIGDTGSKITFGSGSVSNNTVTYFYNSGKTYTKEITGEVLEPTADEKASAGISEGDYIINAISNANVTGTMSGTLTIDGGTDLKSLGYKGDNFRLSRYSSYIYATGKYNTSGNSTDPTKYYDRNDLSLVHSVNGEVQMWPNVIMQNNKSCNRDNTGSKGKNATAYNYIKYGATAGGAVNISGSNSAFYMYGGIISDMVNNHSAAPGSDGGAIAANEGAARIYLYGGEITRCEAQHGGAIELWNTPDATLAIFNTNIHHNLSLGDGPTAPAFPAATIATYALENAGTATDVKMFGGVIAENQNKYTSGHNTADICLYSYTMANIHMYGGTVNEIACGAQKDDVPKNLYIYSAAVNTIKWGNKTGWIYYPASNKLFSVTIPNVVHSDGKVTVNVTAVKDGVTYANITGTGTAADSNITMQLPNGAYTVTATSPSMIKTYTVVVEGQNAEAIATSRRLIMPEVTEKTSSSVTISLAGTGNDAADGYMSYGLAVSNKSSDVKTWYQVKDGVLYKGDTQVTDFTNIELNNDNQTITFKYVYGPRYYFVTSTKGNFDEQTSNGLLVQTVGVKNITVSPENYSSLGGTTVNFAGIVTNTDGTEDKNIKWSFIGGTSSATHINQFGALHIAKDELEKPILKTSLNPIADATELIFTNSVYTVPKKGLAQGYYFIKATDSETYYFHTTSKLIEGDTLTWNNNDKTVTQSVNRIFVTASAANNGAVLKEVMWTYGSTDSSVSYIDEVDLYLNDTVADRIVEFTEDESPEIDFKAILSGVNATLNDNLFLEFTTTKLGAYCKITSCYSFTGNTENYELNSELAYDEMGVAVPNNADGMEIIVTCKTDTGIPQNYRIVIAFKQQQNEWVSNLVCHDTDKTKAPVPFAEALYGTVRYEWYQGDTKLEAVPTEAGTYKVKAIVDKTNLYTGLADEVIFTISEKASPNNVVTFAGLDALVLTYGKTLFSLNDTIKANAQALDADGDKVMGEFEWSSTTTAYTVPTVEDYRNGRTYQLMFTPDDGTQKAYVDVLVKVNASDARKHNYDPTVNYSGKNPSLVNRLSNLVMNTDGVKVTTTEGEPVELTGTWTWVDGSLYIEDQIGNKVDVVFVPDNQNYNIISTTIVPKITITVTALNQQVTYSPDGVILNQSMYAESDYAMRTGDSLKVTMKPIGGNFTPGENGKFIVDAGEYKIQPTINITAQVSSGKTWTDYYIVNAVNGELTVNQTTPIVTQSEIKYDTAGNIFFDFTYNGEKYLKDAQISATNGEVSQKANGTFVNAYNIDITSGEQQTVYVKPESTSTAEVTVSFPKTKNYKAYQFTVAAKNGYTVSNITAEYDGNSYMPTYSSTGNLTIDFFEDSALSIPFKGRKNAGESTVYYKVGEDPIASVTVKITPKPVKVEWKNPDSMVYTGDVIKPTASAIGVGDESIDLIVTAETEKGDDVPNNETKNAGVYYFFATSNDTNYVVIRTAGDIENTDTWRFVIDKATPVVNVKEGFSPTYDGTIKEWESKEDVVVVVGNGVPEYQYDVSVNGKWEQTTIMNDGSVGDGQAPRNAGEYRMRVKIAESDNFKEYYTKYYEFTVHKREITVESDNQTAFNVSSLIAEQNATVVYNDPEISGHEVAYKCSGEQNGVGSTDKTIIVTVKDASGVDITKNYAVTTKPGKLIISSAYLAAGSHYKFVETKDTSVSIDANEAFTVCYNITSGMNNGIQFDFDKLLPQETTLTLMDIKNTQLYYHIVKSETYTFVPSDFTEMGGNTELTSLHYGEWLLIVNLPEKNRDTGNITLNLEANVSAKLNVTCNAVASITLGEFLGGNEVISGNITVNDANSDDMLVVQLKNEDDKIIDMPANASVKLVGTNATINGISATINGDKAVFENLPSDRLEVTVTGKLSGNYTLVFSLCAGVTDSDYPMNHIVDTNKSKPVQVISAPTAVYAELKEGNRFVDSSADTTLEFDVKTSGQENTFEAHCYIKADKKYISTDNITAVVDGRKVTVNIPKETPSATYRIEFTCGTAEYVYNIIVY